MYTSYYNILINMIMDNQYIILKWGTLHFSWYMFLLWTRGSYAKFCIGGRSRVCFGAFRLGSASAFSIWSRGLSYLGLNLFPLLNRGSISCRFITNGLWGPGILLILSLYLDLQNQIEIRIFINIARVILQERYLKDL